MLCILPLTHNLYAVWWYEAAWRNCIENEGDEGPALPCTPQTDSEDRLGNHPFRRAYTDWRVFRGVISEGDLKCGHARGEREDLNAKWHHGVSLLLGAGALRLATWHPGLSPKEITCCVHIGERERLAFCRGSWGAGFASHRSLVTWGWARLLCLS